VIGSLRSLRARLVAALLALSAVGLLLLGGITYFEQRSFLRQRVDQQVTAAIGPVSHALDEQRIGTRVTAPGPGRGPDGPGADRGQHGPNIGLPPGTYGQRRTAAGTFLGSVTLVYGEKVTARPALPASVPLERVFAVGGKGPAASGYRAYARPDPGGATITIAAVPLHDSDQTLNRLLLVELLVIAGVLVVLAALAWLVVRVGLRPLDLMGDTAGAIAGGDLSRRVESTDPRTEVGRLGIALNRMLDRLEKAFAEREASENRLRRFLADASHELRTPLAAIRGYAELFRIGAASDPADVERAMRRTEEEAARMGVLVDDLLTLARLDAVADAAHRDVDLAALARDAVDDARATAPARQIELRADGAATVMGEPDQLRQLLGNLLRNAVVHTPEGTPVDVAVASRDGRVRLEVRDHGPGLPTPDPASLFERFWRKEGGRERGKGGAGLGLAIVAAIVDAHGGEVTACDAPGGGASFVVDLPAARSGDPA
jgi:two-component system OmpR family sensor kinase